MRSSGALKFPFCGRAETCTKLRSVFLSEEPERTLSCFVETTFVAFAIDTCYPTQNEIALSEA